MENSLYHNFGKFIITFQSLEGLIEDLIVEIVGGNDEFVSILITPYDFQSRLKAIDLLFCRYIKEKSFPDVEIEKFKKVIRECSRLSNIRNNFVHSKYSEYVKNNEIVCLIRVNTKLDRDKTERTLDVQDITHEILKNSLDTVELALQSLEEFRQKLVNWNTPLC